jgi:hypothetical protein
VDKRAVSPVLEQDENPLPGHEKTEQSPCVREEPALRLRIAQSTAKPTGGTGPISNVVILTQTVQIMHESRTARDISASREMSYTSPLIAHSPANRSAKEAVVQYHTIGAGTVANAISRIEYVPVRAASPQVIRSVSHRGLPASAAEAPEFKPFQRPPPTAPRTMRAPTAPRAMREGSLERTTWQSRQHFSTTRGHATCRGW